MSSSATPGYPRPQLRRGARSRLAATRTLRVSKLAVVGLAPGVLKLSIRGGRIGWPRWRNSSQFNALRLSCDGLSVGPALGKTGLISHPRRNRKLSSPKRWAKCSAGGC